MWAHSKNVQGHRHRLDDHLRGTADLAGKFAAEFGSAKLGYAAGLLHDVGKCTDDWQAYLLDREASRPTGRVDHKTVGAWLFGKVAQVPGLLSLLGHHTGMPDANLAGRGVSPSESELEFARRRLSESLPELAAVLDGGCLLPDGWATQPEALETRTRMLQSSLVDGDYLDTAAHFNAEPVRLRPESDFEAVFGEFEQQRAGFLKGRAVSPIDAIRQQVYEEALLAAEGRPGIFRLPGPTGSGKTLSSAGFSLRHAALHGKRRIILAVPFLAITAQNAAVLRSLLRDELLLESHSAIDPSERAKYGADNWDAPIVVTTTVQLFESLLSNRPSRVRKLHNIVNSVIVLDELQAIPLRVLPVVVDVLRILVRYFGVTVLLSSATQPAWDQLSAWRDDREIEIHDVIDNTEQLYGSLRRITTEWVDAESSSDVARLVLVEPCALVIVNKTHQARDLSRLLLEQADSAVLHLSTRMHAAHRAEVLAQAKRYLAEGRDFYLVSTQLVEAGVDLDFPVVVRMMAPAENLQQAAGRCNREGLQDRGRLVVVTCAEWTPLHDYKTGIAKTNQYFRSSGADIDDPQVMDAYFVDYYRTAGVDHQPGAQAINRKRRELLMEQVATDFRMIDDDSLQVVVGQVPQAQLLLDEMRTIRAAGGVPSRELWRELQQYCVNLPPFLQPWAQVVADPSGAFVSGARYDCLTGIDVDSRGANDSIW